ncbi:MAG: hypothetical protein HY238_18740 [Acidobacteria bacterium]|nr:hypothetical protein [Acidobacteriota bacterium]
MPPGNKEEPDPYPYIELKRARLCLDCEMIFEGAACPACTSGSFVPVTRWIRPTELTELVQPAPLPPPAPKPRRLLRKSLYVGLGAYGVWKMLFEPSRPRARKPPERPKEDPS